MDKKDLILTVAKDLLCAYKIQPESSIKPGKKVDEIADLLDQMTKRVEKVYKGINE